MMAWEDLGISKKLCARRGRAYALDYRYSADWAFRAKDGATIWSKHVSPGGVTGGMQWGSATGKVNWTSPDPEWEQVPPGQGMGPGRKVP